MRACIAMMADIDFKTIGKEAVINLIRAEEEGQFRLLRGQSLDPAIIGIAEH